MVAQHLKTPCPLYLCTITLSKAHPEKRKTLIMVGQLISSVTLTVLQTNHFLKEQSLLIKCHTDKTQLCYPYVSGEIDISDCNTDENNNETGNNEITCIIILM